MSAKRTMYPAYRALAESGELQRRAAVALQSLEDCRVCPRHCGINRTQDQRGTCQVPRYARVASCFPHFGEEDCLRGWRGSGTIFFSGCNLGCVFCQNWDISHEGEGSEAKPETLAQMMLELQEAGCHNVNWVTPSHVVPQALEALALAASEGLRLPVVYNSGGYDAVEMLRLLDGVVDIYMPDFKFWDPAIAERLGQAPDYPDVARAAVREMHRQVGDLVIDARGIARRGLLVRHLVMPGGIAGTREIAGWLAQALSPNTYLNVMAQYHPAGRVQEAPNPFPDLARRPSPAEIKAAMQEACAAGLHRFDVRKFL